MSIGRVAKSASTGGLAGLLGSLVGLGGGFVAIPALTHPKWLGLTQHAAHGTSLCTAVATGAFGAWGFCSDDPLNVDWEAAAVMAAAGAVSSRFAARFATKHLNPSQLKKAMGAFMVTMGIFTPARPYIMEEVESFRASTKKNVAAQAEVQNQADDCDAGNEGTKTASQTWPISQAKLSEVANLTGVGLGTGMIAGIFGVGGGAILVPALSMLLPERIETHKQALATSLAAMVPLSCVGVLTHYRLGNVPYPGTIGIPLALGSAVGSYMGAHYIAGHMKDEDLRAMFGVLICGMGLRTLRSGFMKGPLKA